MTTKFNVGDAVLIKGIIESIYVENADNEPIYYVRIKGAGTYEAYGIRVNEDVINAGVGNTLTIDDMTAEDIVQWCKTHSDPEKKKQYEEEVARAKALMDKSKEEET